MERQGDRLERTVMHKKIGCGGGTESKIERENDFQFYFPTNSEEINFIILAMVTNLSKPL